MDKTSLILSSLMTVALVIFIAPNIFAFNRGKVLKNIALWLAIFTGLALIYQLVGPDSPHPLFALPPAMVHEQVQPPAPEDKTPSDDQRVIPLVK